MTRRRAAVFRITTEIARRRGCERKEGGKMTSQLKCHQKLTTERPARVQVTATGWLLDKNIHLFKLVTSCLVKKRQLVILPRG